VVRRAKNIAPSQTEGKQSLGKKRSKTAQTELRVLTLIHENHNVSRIALTKLLGASAGSMTSVVHRLIGKGLVVESGKSSANLGRKPVALSLSKDLGYVLGVDLGSFLTRVVVTDMVGNVSYKFEEETRMAEGRESVIARTFDAARKAIRETHVEGALRGIGMAHSGVVDTQSGMVLCFPRPGQMTQWRNVPLRDMMEKEFGVPSVLDDSARMMAVAEKHFGIGREMSDFLFIEVGMGIGAAIFIGGKLYRGPGGSAGEFGHMTVDENGPLCSCGNIGCLEAMASCAAIIRTVRTAIQQGVNSKVTELVEGELEHISIEAIVKAAKDNDTLSFRVLHEAISRIGVMLADVINLLNPYFVVFAGPLFRIGGDFLLDQLKDVIRRRALEKSATEARLQISTLGSEAAALGAARLISEQVLEQLYREKVSMHRHS
jgi:glucokinase-like ROK family protein